MHGCDDIEEEFFMYVHKVMRRQPKEKQTLQLDSSHSEFNFESTFCGNKLTFFCMFGIYEKKEKGLLTLRFSSSKISFELFQLFIKRLMTLGLEAWMIFVSNFCLIRKAYFVQI